MLKLVNAFLKEHRKELGLKGYTKMTYLEKLDYLKSKTKGTKYEKDIAKFTKPRVDKGIKKVLDKSGRGKNIRVKKEKKKPVKFEKLEEAKPSQKVVPKKITIGKVKNMVKDIEKKEPKKKMPNDFSSVKTPENITKSAKIKRQIKDILGVDTTLKLPNKDFKTKTNKALQYVGLAKYDEKIKGPVNQIKEVVEKYDTLPQNIKDNLALMIYGNAEEDTVYKDTPEEIKNLPVFDGRYRFYNP